MKNTVLLTLLFFGSIGHAQSMSLSSFRGPWKLGLQEGDHSCAPRIIVASNNIGTAIQVTPYTSKGQLASKENREAAEATKKVTPNFIIKGLNVRSAQGLQIIPGLFGQAYTSPITEDISVFQDGKVFYRQVVKIGQSAIEWTQFEMEIYPGDHSLVITTSAKLSKHRVDYRCVYLR